jgi:hypothetical protein
MADHDDIHRDKGEPTQSLAEAGAQAATTDRSGPPLTVSFAESAPGTSLGSSATDELGRRRAGAHGVGQRQAVRSPQRSFRHGIEAALLACGPSVLEDDEAELLEDSGGFRGAEIIVERPGSFVFLRAFQQ